MERCILCGSEATTGQLALGFTETLTCQCCGKYTVSNTAKTLLANPQYKAHSFKLASWVYNENRRGTSPSIFSEQVENSPQLSPPAIEKRIELFLGRAIEIAEGRLAFNFKIDDKRLFVASWSTPLDGDALLNYMDQKKLLRLNRPEFSIGVESYLAYEKMTALQRRSSQGFVAMWFDKRLSFAFDEEMRPAIEGSGYEALKIDRVEHVGKIDDEIIAQIRRSAFVVADFSGHRGGVYYEAGFAHGLGIPVFFTCHEKCLNKLHFDIRQYNTLVWRKPHSLRIALQNRILAVLGAGPNKPDAQPIHIS